MKSVEMTRDVPKKWFREDIGLKGFYDYKRSIPVWCLLMSEARMLSLKPLAGNKR